MGSETDVQAGAAREGDESAFARLYSRVGPALYAWAKFRIHGPMQRRLQPEDVVQEVWWRALEGFSRFDASRGSFRAWMFAIANNVLREALRRRPSSAVPQGPAREPQSLSPELAAQVTSISTELGRRQEVAQLVDTIARLTREDQRLVVQCGLEGQVIKEVAPQLGLSAAAAQQRWRRLRQQLRENPVWARLHDALTT